MVTTGGPAEQFHRGQGLGLPSSGVGSVASFGRRTGAFFIDVVPGDAILMSRAILGIRVVPMSGGDFVGLWAIPRTALIFLIVPPLLQNSDGRGLHDRLCRTVVLRYR